MGRNSYDPLFFVFLLRSGFETVVAAAAAAIRTNGRPPPSPYEEDTPVLGGS